MKNNFIIGIIVTIFAGLNTSCVDDHVEPVDMTLKVGNVYCANSAIIPVDYYLQGYNSQAVGVVAAVGTEEDNFRALIMSLEDLGRARFLNDVNIEVDNIYTDAEEYNGKESTSALVYAASQNDKIYPDAALLCSGYMAGSITGWHLPAIAEWKRTVVNKETISRTLALLEVQGFRDDWYQTSTADGASDETILMYNYVITLPEGRVTSSIMTEEHYVRPFLTLK